MKYVDFEKCNGRGPYVAGSAPEFKPSIRDKFKHDGHLGGVEQAFSNSDVWDDYDEYMNGYDPSGVPRDHFGFRLPRD